MISNTVLAALRNERDRAEALAEHYANSRNPILSRKYQADAEEIDRYIKSVTPAQAPLPLPIDGEKVVDN